MLVLTERFRGLDTSLSLDQKKTTQRTICGAEIGVTLLTANGPR